MSHPGPRHMQGLHPEWWESGLAVCPGWFWKEEGFAGPGAYLGILGTPVTL